jgi:hypothetical protein
MSKMIDFQPPTLRGCNQGLEFLQRFREKIAPPQPPQQESNPVRFSAGEDKEKTKKRESIQQKRMATFFSYSAEEQARIKKLYEDAGLVFETCGH